VACRVALKPVRVELSVERELAPAPDGSPRRARLSAEFEATGAPDAYGPEAADVGAALVGLARRLEEGIERAEMKPPERPERSLAELVERYHPRQAELVQVLFEDGEITEKERALLAEHVATLPASSRRSSPERAPAAASNRGAVRAERGGEVPTGGGRPVPELLSTYRIHTLKEAGAVRARRQISYDEYMALRRHFSTDAATAG
jgi:hypothetical protein